MLNVVDIKNYLISQNRIFDFDVRLRPSDQTILLYVPQRKLSLKANKNFTSIRQLNNLKKKLFEKYSRQAEVILVQDDTQQELEAGFYQILNRKFNERIISLYISFREGNFVDAFIEISEINEHLQYEITEHFDNVLSGADLHLGEIHWLGSPSDLPTQIALLRMLKILQPISLHEFTTEIQKEYSSVTEKWLNRKLDHLRKKRFIMRQKVDGSYALTDMGLRSTPAGSRKTSSDVDRALAFGRRKW